MKQTFWQKNQVFLTGIASALTLALTQFISKPEGEIDWKVIGIAALIGIASYVGNEWRGKGVTVTGFIGVVAYTFYSVYATGTFSWNQFILSCVIGFLALVAPPPKPATYEQSPTIQQAKDEAATIKQVQDNTPPKQV